MYDLANYQPFGFLKFDWTVTINQNFGTFIKAYLPPLAIIGINGLLLYLIEEAGIENILYFV